MTFQELQTRCKNRVFDCITVVVDDIFQELAQMQRIRGIVPGDLRICTQETDPGLKNDAGTLVYKEKRASFFYENIELMIVEPVEGDTIYKKYLEQYGPSICCVRERVTEDMFVQMEERFRSKGIDIAQKMESDSCTALWADLTKEIGILFELVTENSEKPYPFHTIPEKLVQINITTPDVRETIEKITDILEIGPWEVGRQCNQTATKTGFRVNGKLEDIDFDFLLAILPCGNLEWEVIEPVKGQLCYNEFLERRGAGYHHILQEIPQADWTAVQEKFFAKGIEMASKGSIGPIDWCYMDTEKELKFYTELRSDAVMTKLPEGYVQYFYPEAEEV